MKKNESTSVKKEQQEESMNIHGNYKDKTRLGLHLVSGGFDLKLGTSLWEMMLFGLSQWLRSLELTWGWELNSCIHSDKVLGLMSEGLHSEDKYSKCRFPHKQHIDLHHTLTCQAFYRNDMTLKEHSSLSNLVFCFFKTVRSINFY